MAVIIKLWRHIENPTQSMRIYSKNNPAKFHPDLIWNDRALGFFVKPLTLTTRRTTTSRVEISDQFVQKVGILSPTFLQVVSYKPVQNLAIIVP